MPTYVMPFKRRTSHEGNLDIYLLYRNEFLAFLLLAPWQQYYCEGEHICQLSSSNYEKGGIGNDCFGTAT